MSATRRDREFLIELDGPEVSPATVDSRALLEVTSSYLDLLVAMAAEHDQMLHFTGLVVRDKCVAVAVRVDRYATVVESMKGAARYLRGAENPPAGLAQATLRVRAALGRLPEKYEAKAIAGSYVARLTLPRAKQVPPPPTEQASLRALLLRIGGVKCVARFQSASEAEPFTVAVPKEEARSLARHLYREVDVELMVDRNEQGDIEGGRLVEFHPIEEGDTVDDWTSFHRAEACEWDVVEDIEGELGRGD